MGEAESKKTSEELAGKKTEYDFLHILIDLCDALAWGRPADEDALFALTRQDAADESLVKLAEAFGMMMVKVEARNFHLNELIKDLQNRNAELETAKALLAERHARLTGTLQEEYASRRIIGHCDAMKKVVDMALSIARHPINTLVLGPTGAGKEVIAKTIHFNSPRNSGPFIAVNCTAIPDSLFESEMFGIEKGVATGVNARKGLIEEANGGTLFLDELGDLSMPNQAKLLRVLEENEVMRVGSVKAIPVDIKVVAATNVDLLDAIRKNHFREDLYYRINVAEIHIPPLRERGDDILLLAQHFLQEHALRMGRQTLALSPETRDCLMTYPWPGNVRELNNEMERAAALTLGDLVLPSDLSPRLLNALPNLAPIVPKQVKTKQFNLAEAEIHLVEQALSVCKGNRSQAAELLGISREGLRKKLLRMPQFLIPDTESPSDADKESGAC